MSLQRAAPLIIFTSLMFLGAGVISAQSYPNKAIHIVVSEPGSNSDILARILASELPKVLGVPVVTDNRPSTIIGDLVAKASPDGYTLLINGTLFWLGPLLQRTAYDPVEDFEAISRLTTAPLALIVHPSVPVTSVIELIALAKAKPGVLNYSSTGPGGAIHLAAELFKSMAGVNIVRVTYKGPGDAFNAVIAGEVQLMFSTSGAQVIQQANLGKLRLLAVSSDKPSALFPGVPTVAISGLPGYEAINTQGLFAPAKTPTAIVTRINQEVVRILNSADIASKILGTGAETAIMQPEQFSAFIKSDIARMGKVIKDAGLHVD